MDIELAWAAGFFDGEGTVTVTTSKIGYPPMLMVSVVQSATTPDVPAVVARFAAAIGCGRIGGPYQYAGRRRPVFKWWARGVGAELALERLDPYLTGRKRDQAAEARQRLAELLAA